MLSLHRAKHKRNMLKTQRGSRNKNRQTLMLIQIPLSKVCNMILSHFTPHFIIFHHHILCYQAASPLGQVFPNPHLAVYIDQFSPWRHDPTASVPGSCNIQATNSRHFPGCPTSHKINQNHRPGSWCLRKVVASTEHSLQTRQFFTEPLLKDIQEMIRTGAM